MPTTPGADTVELVPIDSIEPWPGNPRTHDLEAIQESLRLHGQYRPVYAQRSTRRLVMGHGTWEAATAEGWTELAVTFLDVDDDEAGRILLVDNRTSDLAGYDDGALAAMLQALAGTPAGLTGTGYDDGSLAELLGTLAGESEPRSYEPPDRVYTPRDDRPPISVLGDLWLVGGHRLMCGDATVAEDMARLRELHAPVLALFDPPYGVAVDHRWRDGMLAESPAAALHAPGRPGDLSGDSELRSWAEAYRLCPADVFLCWHSALYAADAMGDLQAAGYEVMQQVIWDKGDAPILGRSYYHWNHEAAWFGKRRGGRVPWHVGRDQITVWRAAPPNRPMTPGSTGEERTDHPTQKPVAIYERPIRNHTLDGQTIIDPFAGSGTALVAAARMGRIGLGMELDPRWTDVALRRLLAHTDEPQVARIAPDGRSSVLSRDEVLATVAAETGPDLGE